MQVRGPEPVVHVDTGHVAYVTGRFLASSSLDALEMSFVPLKDLKIKSVAAMALSTNKKYLAIGERSSETAQIVVVQVSSWSVKRVLTFGGSKEVVYLCFSGDGKYIMLLFLSLKLL